MGDFFQKNKINFIKEREKTSENIMTQVGYYGAENIHNLVPRALPEIIKPKIYTSKHRQWVKDTSRDGKHSVRTMGYVKTPLNPPSSYLKKYDRTQIPANAISAAPFKYPGDKRPPVPTSKVIPAEKTPPKKLHKRERYGQHAITSTTSSSKICG